MTNSTRELQRMSRPLDEVDPDIAAVIRVARDETDAAEVSRLLVNYALARGGQDNVSVAVYAHA